MPDFDPDVADMYGKALADGAESPCVQGYLMFIAERTARGEVSEFTQRAAAAVVAGVREHDLRSVAA